MTDQPAPAGQLLSLPQGGGALKGLGEKFSPDLFTGAGSLNLPIPLPKGRGGFQPELALSYSTGAGNGPFGLGWSLSVPQVARKTSGGVPRYRDRGLEADTFVLSGGEDLVPVPGGTGPVQRYRPRAEGLFARIEHHTGPGGDFWRVSTPDGLVSTYGSPKPASAGPDWDDPAVITDPLDRTKIFAWMLTETRNPFGSRCAYEYRRDRPDAGPRRWDQVYIDRIRYVNYPDPNGAERFLISVSFDYSDPAAGRPDPFSTYRAGFEIRTRLRCERIRIHSHAGADRLVRMLRLGYSNASVNRVSLLDRFELVGSDEIERMPALTFTYTKFEPDRQRFEPVPGRRLPTASLSDPNLELVDLFGSGLPDLVELGDRPRYWRSLGPGGYDLPRFMTSAPSLLSTGRSFSPADPGVRLLDADGDGRLDLAVSTDDLSGFFPLRFNGEWDRRSFQAHDFAPSFRFDDPEVRLVDLDGDGVTDAVRSGARLELFFNHPRRGWSETRRLERGDPAEFPNVSFADPQVHLADFSGDGLQDIARVTNGSVEYWPALGRGSWGRRIRMQASPVFPPDHDPRRVLLGDIDGDGLADLVYVDHRRVFIWINRGGEAWSDPVVVSGTPDLSDAVAVRLADLHGSGTTGLVWSYAAGSLPSSPLFYLDFSGGRKAYLLAEIDNHMGAVTRIEYAPSTRFYLQDQAVRRNRWKTSLPFPVQVVAGVETIDRISGGKLTTRYHYRHGSWDGGEREFRGFGCVEQVDTQTFESFHLPAAGFEPVSRRQFAAPTLTRSWFHLGPVGDEYGDWEEPDWSDEFWPDDPQQLDHKAGIDAFLRTLPDRRSRRDALRCLRGSPLRTEFYALDGSPLQERPYTVTETAAGLRQETPPGPAEAGRARIFFAFTTAQRTTQHERGRDPMTRFEFKEDYDAFGRPRLQAAVACPRGWRSPGDPVPAGTPFLGTCTHTLFAEPAPGGPYLHDRVARSDSFEIVQNGVQTLFEFKAQAADPAQLKLIGQNLAYYDGEAFEGLPFGQVGSFGAATRSETLILTEAILAEAYAPDGPAPPEFPPYLVPTGPPAWTADYPQSFRDSLAERAGYTFFDGSGPQGRGYFVSYGCTRYDFQSGPGGFGLPLAQRDALGRETLTAYDEFHLLPLSVQEASGALHRVEYDYGLFQPRLSIDPNGNRVAFTYSPLGFMTATFLLGKPGETAGDHPNSASTRFEYGFLAFEAGPPGAPEPVFTRTLQRPRHDPDGNIPEADAEVLVRVEYSDGFGRVIQKRAIAEDLRYGDDPFGNAVIPVDPAVVPGPSLGRLRPPGSPPNVLVSGRQVYDNKGQVVEQYEPFYSTGLDYAPPSAEQFGQKTELFYDPRGQLIRTVHPNGSVNRMIYGVPLGLDTPDDFDPTPWEVYTYNVNDNAAGFSGEHNVPAAHFHTPSSLEIDGLGRTVRTTARLSPTEALVTRSEYDIRGNLLRIIDPLGRTAFRYVYDLSSSKKGSAVLREECLDAGTKRIVFDSTGREVERRDAGGALILQAYDPAGRPERLWARDPGGQNTTLRQRFIYGEAAGLVQPEAANLIGKVFRHFTEAGLVEMTAYDFKGNLLRQTQRVIRDEVILAAMDAAELPVLALDWESPQAVDALEPQAFITDMTYDALNRMVRVVYPEDALGERKTLLPGYDRAGRLERVSVAGGGGPEQVFVRRIAYNARGQRALIAYGSGLMTRHAYDPVTGRLVRMRTERYTLANPTDFIPDGGLLQDSAYGYDLLGSLVRIAERSPGCGIPNTPLGANALERRFEYDPLGRLVRAGGREHLSRGPSSQPWLDAVLHTNQDGTQSRPYTQEYSYDDLGSLTALRHISPDGSAGFTREFSRDPAGNRLESFSQGGLTFACRSDPRGNLVQHAADQRYAWNHSSRLAAYRRVDGGGNPSVEAVYLYDSLGQRVKKVVRRGTRVETTTYVSSSFERRTSNGQSHHILHLMDDQHRIARVRTGPAFPGDESLEIEYDLGDHLGSSAFTTSAAGDLIRREEYYPYGDTSFGSYARKRYRFTARERDDESGLSYHRSRYYAPWAARWISPDPAGRADGLNLYAYARGSPLGLVDPSGTSAVSWIKTAGSKAWDFSKALAKFNLTGDAFGYEFPLSTNPYHWQNEAFDLIWDKTKTYWNKAKRIAENLWSWASAHKKLATGIGIGAAAGLGLLGYFAGKWLLNWVVAPAVRIGTNAAFGYIMWGKEGAWIGALTGAVHGFSMAYAGTYKSALGLLTFAFDNSWSLFNSFAASFFNLIPIFSGSINKTRSQENAGLYHDWWIGSNVSTTIGNVTAGEAVPDHEAGHAWQARLLGPFYIPSVILNYEVATLLPYWVFTTDCDITGPITYFTRGVYPNTWHEAMAYEISGDKCSL